MRDTSSIYEPLIPCIFRERLKTEIKSFGANPSPRQSLLINARRKALAESLTLHREQAVTYCPPTAAQLATETVSLAEGAPERLSTLLPSHFPPGALGEDTHAAVIDTEKQLRRVSCLKALQDVRGLVAQKAHYQQVKSSMSMGTVARTRAQVAMDALNGRILHARWQYQHSRQQLFTLGASSEDQRTLKTLKDTDLRELTSLMRGDHTPGQGYRSLPWYWRIETGTLIGVTDDSEVESRIAREYEESG
jgi:hypothetical protein